MESFQGYVITQHLSSRGRKHQGERRTKESLVPEMKRTRPKRMFCCQFQRYKKWLLEAAHRITSSLAPRLTKATLLIILFISVNARRVCNVGIPFTLMCGERLLSTHLPWPDNGSPTSNLISGD